MRNAMADRLPPGVSVVDPHVEHHRGYWGSELVAKPELLEPPRPVVPFLAWQGRVTMTAGSDKVGKSTLWRQAAAALTRGSSFLGGTVNDGKPGKVLWFGLEEALADIWRPFAALDVDPSRVYVVNSIDGMVGVKQAMDVTDRWVLVVIDTLAALGHACEIVSERDETEMTALMQRILGLARFPEPFGGPAVGIVHHQTRGENPRERGSGAIPANCDVILNLSARKDAEGFVDVTGRARGGIEVKPFGLKKQPGYYELAQAGEEAAADAKSARILQLVVAEPGEHTGNSLYQRLKGNRQDLLRSVDHLVALGILFRDKAKLYPSSSAGSSRFQNHGTDPVGWGGSGGSPPKGGENQRTTSEPHPPTTTGAIDPEPLADHGEAWDGDEPDTSI